MALQCICRSKQFENPTRTRRDNPRKLKITNFWRHFWHTNVYNKLQKSYFPIEVKIVDKRHKETIDISCTDPIRHPSRDMTKNDSYTLNK